MGNLLDPEDWGWKRTPTGLESVRTMKEPAPPSLLHLVSCKYTKDCGSACDCRKAGLSCSVICKNCEGENCDNKAGFIVDSEDEECEELPSWSEAKQNHRQRNNASLNQK